MNSSVRPTRWQFMRGNILVLTITQAMGQVGRNMAYPYASLFILALGGEPAQVGLINSLVPLAGLLAFPVAGYLADASGRVRLIAVAGAFSGVIYLLYAVSPSWQMIAVLAALQGLIVVQFPPSSALIADSLAPADRVKGTAAMNGIAGALSLGAPFLAGLLIDRVGVAVGLRILYGALGAIYVLSAGINARFLRETVRQDSPMHWANLWGLLRDAYAGIPSLLRSLTPSVRALALVVTLGFVANALAGPFWVVYAVQQLGLTSSEWGLILLLEMALLNLSYLPAAAFTDRLGRTRVLQLSLALALVIMPLFVWVRGFWPVLLIRAMMAVSNGFFMPACSALVADSIPREMRGRAMAALGRGLVMFGATSGGTGGPGLGFLIIAPMMAASLSGGYLYALNPTIPWYASTAAALLALAVSLRYVRDPQQAHV